MELNKTLIQKADLALSTMVSDGGYLRASYAKQFIEIMIKSAKLSGMIRAEGLNTPTQYVDKLGFTGQVLQPGTPGVALSLAQRSKPELGSVQWDAKMFKCEVRLNNAVLEQNIEQGNLQKTIIDKLTKAVGRDTEYVIIQGDTTSSTPLLAVLDGILAQATSNPVNASSTRTDVDLLDQMLRGMPEQFANDVSSMKFITSINAKLDYVRHLASRGDIVGGNALTNGTGAKYNGVEVVDIPLFPKTGFPSTNETNILLTDPKNIRLGIWKKIRVDTGKDVSAGVVIIVVETWFDVKFEEENSVVKAYAVLNS